MKKLDFRSVIIGFLLAVIFVLSIGATKKYDHFDTISVNEIAINEGGKIYFAPVDGKLTTIDVDGLFLGNSNSKSLITLNRGDDLLSDPHLTFIDTMNSTILSSGGIALMDVGIDTKEGTLIMAGSVELKNDSGESVVELFSNTDNHGVVVLRDKYGDIGWAQSGKQ